MKISAVVLARNEAQNLPECLRALRWADETWVIDSGSTDETQACALAGHAKWVLHEFVNFCAQRNFAMSVVQSEWILFIDADERVSGELAAEIQSVILKEPCAYAIPRHNYFFGKRLRFSGSRDDAPVRLFPRGSGLWKQPVHEYFETALPVKKLTSALIHHTTRDLSHYWEKARCYIPLEAETMRAKGRRGAWYDPFWRAPAKFFYLYLIKAGILDGLTGLQFALLSAYYDWKKHRLFLNHCEKGNNK